MRASAARELLITLLVAAGLCLPLIGLYGDETGARLVIETRWPEMGVSVALIVAGRAGLILCRAGHWRGALAGGLVLSLASLLALPHLPMATRDPGRLGGHLAAALQVIGTAEGLVIAAVAALSGWKRAHGITATDIARARERREAFLAGRLRWVAGAVALLSLLLPALFRDAYIIDSATTVLLYVMLAWGLNIVVGYAGLLDLGFIAFYAFGAYSYALLNIHFGLGFWTCLPLAGMIAAMAGLALGFPVLRLRGDYFAIVTLGFGEIVRIVITNWSSLTLGSHGITRIPAPGLFGLSFEFKPPRGTVSFSDLFGLAHSPIYMNLFLYYLVLTMVFLVGWFTLTLRRLPIGRAWEALREDDIACAALGINRVTVKLAAFALSACWGGLAGAIFAARQGYINPDSFEYMDSAMILAIVVLGGMGNLVGIALAALLLIGLPEAFRDLQDFRMLAFGAGMAAIMIWRPQGLISHREPSVLLKDHPA